jgi:protein-tyrosine-phosphatase
MTKPASLARRSYRRVRGLLVALRDGYDRNRHPRRRESEIARLRSLESPGSVLFVCLGNVCRSPYAEWSMRKSLGDSDIRIASAGFIGPDRNPPDVAIEAALENGVDHAESNSQLVTGRLLADVDVVFLFQGSHAQRLRKAAGTASPAIFQLGEFDPLWDGKRIIVDPWGKPLDEFRCTFSRIDRCLAEVRSVLVGD